MPKIYLIHGFVGSGKTTFAKKLAQETGAVRFTPDEWMIHFYGTNPKVDDFENYHDRVKDMIWQMTREFVARDQSVILDYGFWTRQSRDEYRNKVKELSAEVILYALPSDFQVCKNRALKRTVEMPAGALVIDENALNLFWQKFEAIQDDEDFHKV